jgi:hypothetical protein
MAKSNEWSPTQIVSFVSHPVLVQYDYRHVFKHCCFTRYPHKKDINFNCYRHSTLLLVSFLVLFPPTVICQVICLSGTCWVFIFRVPLALPFFTVLVWHVFPPLSTFFILLKKINHKVILQVSKKLPLRYMLGVYFNSSLAFPLVIVLVWRCFPSDLVFFYSTGN